MPSASRQRRRGTGPDGLNPGPALNGPTSSFLMPAVTGAPPPLRGPGADFQDPASVIRLFCAVRVSSTFVRTKLFAERGTFCRYAQTPVLPKRGTREQSTRTIPYAVCDAATTLTGVSMASVGLSTVAIYRHLGRAAMRSVAATLIGQPGHHAELTSASDIHIGAVPRNKIVRMLPIEWVNHFFDTGNLLLGSYAHFRLVEDYARGDTTEGKFLVVNRSGVWTGFYDATAGFNHRVLCCTLGDPTDALLAEFNADSGFTIHDPVGFSEAMRDAIGAGTGHFGQCVYPRHKVIVAQAPEDHDFGTLDHNAVEMVGLAKYFVKPPRFAPQQEFRFCWEMQDQIDDSKPFHCPAALKFCSPLGKLR